jgi:cytochrome c5
MTAARRRLGIGAIALSALAACGYPPEGSAPKPLTPDTVQVALARTPGVTPEQLADGEKTFAAACNGCHHYPDRDAFSAEQWPGILDKMAPNAHLDRQQHEDVLRYILATRTATPAAGEAVP